MKNKFLKIIAIGTVYIFASSSVFGVISLQDSKDPISNFWIIQSIDTKKVYADDDDDDNYKNHDDDDNYKNHDDDDDDDRKQNITNNITNRNSTVPNQNITNNITNRNSTVPNQNITNNITNRNSTVPNTIRNSSPGSNSQVCITDYDTVTSASGTTSQVPRQSCTDKVVSPTISVPVTPIIQSIIPQSQKVIESVNTGTGVYNDGVYTGTGKYLFTGGSISYTVSIEISKGKIKSAKFIDFTESGNGKYTRSQGDQVLAKLIGTSNSRVDTISGASGTSVAVQDAVIDALNKAKSNSIDSKKVSNIKIQDKSIEVKDTLYIAPNKKVYKLHRKNDNKYTFIKPDGTISTLSFNSERDVKSYIDKYNHDIKVIKSVRASNGKKFTILQDITAGNYYFQREDGTNSVNRFNSVLKTIIYIIKNNIRESITLYKGENGETYTIIEKGNSVTIKKSNGTYALKSFTNKEDAIIYLKQNTKKTTKNTKKTTKNTKKTTNKKIVTTPVVVPKKTTSTTTKVSPVKITTPVVPKVTPVITTTKTTTPQTQTQATIPKVDTTTRAS